MQSPREGPGPGSQGLHMSGLAAGLGLSVAIRAPNFKPASIGAMRQRCLPQSPGVRAEAREVRRR